MSKAGVASESNARAEAVHDVLLEAPALPPPVRPRDGRLSLVSIDVLRGLAAFAVVALHVDVLYVETPPGGIKFWISEVVNHGWLGVSLFFVISGFCIHLPYALMPRIDAREYAVRRLVRIWPPFAVAILVGLVACVVNHEGSWNLVPYALLHMAFLLVGNSPIRHENLVLWSIVVEVQLYFIYLAIRLWSPRSITLRAWTIFFLAIGLAYHLVIARWPLPDFYERIFNPRFVALARMGEWLLGALVADATVRRSTAADPQRRHSQYGVLLLVGGIAVVLATRVSTRWFGLEQYMLETIDACGFALLVAGLIALEQKARHDSVDDASSAGTWPLRMLAAAGQRCYSLYLFHFLLLRWVVVAGLHRFLPAGTREIDVGSSSRGVALITVAVLSALVVAEIVYQLVEKPSHKLARRWAQAVTSSRRLSQSR